MGQRLPRHGAVVRGQTQKFLTPAAKSFVAGTSLPWTAETCCGRFSPRKVHSGETGRRGGGRRVDCAIRRSCLTHRQVCRERRFRRDRGGATGTVAASLVFQTSDRSGSPKPRQRVRRRLAGAPAAACRSRADDRMPPGSREPKGAPFPGVTTTERAKKKNASHHDGQEGQEGQRRRRGPPAFQAGVSLPGFSGGLAGHTPAGAGE
ncbi:hypothetical protein [Escherichia coli]|uniref:hypothetical protein n=1 Tax=Escherichia coli TaxID=562 RepID=UPI002ACBFBD3|nr:hypothetical protein [Escherichia coli]